MKEQATSESAPRAAEGATAEDASLLQQAASDPRARALLKRRLAKRRVKGSAAADEANGAADGAATEGAANGAAEAGGQGGDFSPAVAAAVMQRYGMVTAAAKTDDGRPIPVGSYVEVTQASTPDTVTVRVFSGINGEATIPVSSFRAQPGLVQQTDAAGNATGPRDDTYQAYANPLWGADGPKAEDADSQGAIGDCYFMAALGAVCRSHPDAIKQLISPHGPSSSYAVHFFADAGDGSLQRSPAYQVDGWLPTLHGSDHQRAYSGKGVLWVSLLEKAWALHKGSYHKAQGGWGRSAMEALTGQRSKTIDAAGDDGKGAGLIDQLRQLQKENQAVCIGTFKDLQRQNIGWTKNRFQQSGERFTAQLDPSLVFESVSIYSPNFQGKDDSNNNILQSGGAAKLEHGAVDYQKGTVELQFGGAARPQLSELQVMWAHCGPDYQRYGLVGQHEYRFVDVREPDAVNLRNPWGVQHPKPVDEKGMAKLFNEIASNRVPGADSTKDKQAKP